MNNRGVNKVSVNQMRVNVCKVNSDVPSRRKTGAYISYPGLIAAWSDEGKTNEDKDRDVLRDLTGNGHDLQLYNVAFLGMSGHGGYTIDFKNYNKTSSIINSVIENSRIILNPEDSERYYVYIDYGNEGTNSFKCNIKGVQEGVLEYQYANSAENKRDAILINSNGIYTIPKSDKVDSSYQVGFYIKKKFTGQIIIELIPEYPGALVLDGVNDYGICENMPLLNEFTIISKRLWLLDTKTNTKEVCFISKRGGSDVSFTLEWYGYNRWKVRSLYGGEYDISYPYEGDIVWMNSNSYNGTVDIKDGNRTESQVICLGRDGMSTSRFFQGAFYSAYLFDRSLEEQEIKDFIRRYIDPEYLLPSEIPTPDCYYDFTDGDNTATDVATIKDLSGNGNDAVAYNFDWNEEGSGYKDGALYLDGVDDYIALEAFDSGFKTVFMVCKPFILGRILYDQRSASYMIENAIFNQENKIAYKAKNVSGVTYINNIKNDTLKTDNLLNKKHCITSIFSNKDSVFPKIGKNIDSNNFTKMALYKFLGFKEALTEEQINAIIQKYNLLDGVDDIEVSQNN